MLKTQEPPRGGESDGCQFLRHERLTVAMLVAQTNHHASRGQSKARAGEGDHEMHCAATFHTHPPPQAAGVHHFFLDDDEPPAAGSRPDRLLDVSGPQERDQRRSVAQIEVTVPSVPILDVAVPQVVDQLVEVFRHLDTEVPEQVTDVPKIILEDIPVRALVRGQ